MKILCKENKTGRNPKKEISDLKEKLKKFYDSTYKKLIKNEKDLTYTHLNTVLDYETISLITDYENHIKNHFYDFFNRYINVILNKKILEQKIKNKKLDNKEHKKQLSELRKEFRCVKNAIIDDNEKYENKKYKKIIEKIKKDIFNDAKPKISMLYDVQKNPLNYLQPLHHCTFKMPFLT